MKECSNIKILLMDILAYTVYINEYLIKRGCIVNVVG